MTVAAMVTVMSMTVTSTTAPKVMAVMMVAVDSERVVSSRMRRPCFSAYRNLSGASLCCASKRLSKKLVNVVSV